LYSGSALRHKFLEYFGQRDHLILPSASLIPRDDPTLLLTVAGMVPFKPYFQGKAAPPHPRVTTVQKCLRTADLEIVGKTARHHTFFEMLGNFSFGDYFKKEAIAWSWDFLTRELGLPPSDLWITVYTDDDEAAGLWRQVAGIPGERIVRLGDDSNFWAAGPVGPCGPCSEILIDLGSDRGCGRPECGVDCDCGRYLELWNLVFMQYFRDEAGHLSNLPRQNIDTGMGLERIASVIQGVPNNFETDLLFPLIRETALMAGIEYGAVAKNDIALKVISDHARAVAFLIGDGVTPANEGRGYVLRRILRRAVRYGRMLGIEGPFFDRITGKAIALYQDAYHELQERQDFIRRIVVIEEERFGETLEQGMQILYEHLDRMAQSGDQELPGQIAFRLYDTFGFPLEMTQEILEERGLAVDVGGFRAAMEEQRERARASRQDVAARAGSFAWEAYQGMETGFMGYNGLSSSAHVMAIVEDDVDLDEARVDDRVQVLLDTTSFYPEGGGQVGDRGTIKGPTGLAEVEFTKKIGGLIVHQGIVRQGVLRKGDLVLAEVDREHRQATERNHTATHLLHQALRTVLGEHVHQTGSYVGPARLRFDFSHFAPLTPQELKEVEEIVNREILGDLLVRVSVTDRESALKQGAMALFGEKYGDQVRVVVMGDFSQELCGGTHVRHTSELALFKILSDTGIGTGTRRIEALTGAELLKYWKGQDRMVVQAAEALRVAPDNLLARIEQLQSQLHTAEKYMEELRSKAILNDMDALLDCIVDVDGVKLLAANVQASDLEALRSLGDLLKQKLVSGVIVLGSAIAGKVDLVSFVTGDLVKREGLHAGAIIKEVALLVDGGGGGRPDMAQAGGKNPARLDEALQAVAGIVHRQLSAKIRG
jgi:alanyl-tRNA synthetase